VRFVIKHHTYGAARLIRVAAAFAAFAASAAYAQSPIPSLPSDGSITPDQLDTAIAAIETREGLDEATRVKIIDQLRDAGAQLENRRSAEASAAAFADALQTAPAKIEELRRQLDRETSTTPTAADLGVDYSTPLPELEQLLARESATLSGAESRLAELDAQIGTQEQRPAAARKRMSELRSARDGLTNVVNAVPPAGESALLTEARKLAASLSRDANTAELARLEQELLSHDVRLSELKAQRDLAARIVSEQRARVNLLLSEVNDRRQAAASKALQDAAIAEMAAAGKHPVLRHLAEGNLELTRELAAITGEIDRVSHQLADTEKQRRLLEDSLARSKQRLEIGGVNQVIGRLMVEERRNLPQVSQYRNEVRDRRKTLSNIGLAQVRIEEQRRELSPLAEKSEQLMAEIEADEDDPAELESMKRELDDLLRDWRNLLNQASSTYTSYLRALGDLDVAQRALLDAAEDYEDFLDSNLLWIPSAAFFGIKSLRAVAPAAAWALSPVAWLSMLATMTEGLLESLAVAIPVFLLIALAWITRGGLARRFADISQRVGDLKSDRIGLTLAALGISALRALPLPALLALAGWVLERTSIDSDFSSAVSVSLSVVAPFLYNTLLFRVLCARQGVMQIHFGWSEDNLPMLRRQFDRLTVVGVPLVFFAALLFNSAVPAYREGLARLLFVAVMVVFSGI